MLVGTTTQDLREMAASILAEKIGVQPCADFQGLMWVDPKTYQIEWVVGFTGFIGKTCQGHMVNLTEAKYVPRKLLWASFDYPFNQLGLEVVFGILNSKNVSAASFDEKAGFKEIQRFPGVHEDGGDLILLAMKKAECRWIKESKQ